MARLRPKAYLGLHLTLGIVACTLGVSIFGALLDALLDNSLMVRVDMATDAFIHDRMGPSLRRIVSVTTNFGSPIVVAVLGVVGAILLWRARQWVVLLGWTAAFAGGAVIETVLKHAVHRTRPVYAAGVVHDNSFSFPSGHAMGSMIAYSMLLMTLFLFWHPKRRWKIMLYGIAALLVIAIGLSRVFIGAHYPSDVAGGWAAALAWLAVCMTGVSVARGRPTGVEPVHSLLS